MPVARQCHLKRNVESIRAQLPFNGSQKLAGLKSFFNLNWLDSNYLSLDRPNSRGFADAASARDAILSLLFPYLFFFLRATLDDPPLIRKKERAAALESNDPEKFRTGQLSEMSATNANFSGRILIN